MPVTKGLQYFLKVTVSEPTARQKTEQAGQAYVEVQTAQVEALERNPSESPKDEPKGPAVQQLSVDGALVPLVKQRWSEVKTLAIGTVGEPKLRKGELEVHTGELSYFSRMTDHETFARLATVETHRRGTETAGKVCAVNDGAVWEQEFVDLHRPDAVRILDWGHSSEHLGEVGPALYGVDTSATEVWLKGQRHELRHGDSEMVLADLRRLRDELAFEGGVGLGAEALKVVVDNLEYLEKRREQIHYAEFEQAGYPIGSGAVESGNKLVVEARLKGAGMHWADHNVDRMVALRNIACSDRWEEAWPQIGERLRAQVREHSAARRAKRKAAKAVLVEAASEMSASAQPVTPTRQAPVAVLTAPAEPAANHIEEQAKAGPRRPAADHPWRHMPIGKARRR
ncbi:MAG: hypothetical protein Q8P22_01095 [Chloroflexota bacterium]|nr:hypothetical protein [Chloroflexota bacterium]